MFNTDYLGTLELSESATNKKVLQMNVFDLALEIQDKLLQPGLQSDTVWYSRTETLYDYLESVKEKFISENNNQVKIKEEQ